MATPSYPLTQFTPAPSCGIGSTLWAVTKSCYLYAGTDTVLFNPPWMTCTAAQMGEPPEKHNGDCYSAWRTSDVGLTTSLFSTCPVGYSAASTETFWPYFRTTTNQVGGAPKTTTLAAKDVQASIIYCCPSAPGSGLHFGLDLPDDFRVNTVHDGITYSGYTYVMPRCRATATALSGQTVTLTPFSDTIGGERRRQESTPLITEIWDEAKKVYAEAESFVHTVFADGHTCYGTCDQYWSSQYTSPATATVGSKTGTSPAPTSGTCRVAQKTGWRRMRGFMLAAAVAATVLV